MWRVSKNQSRKWSKEKENEKEAEVKVEIPTPPKKKVVKKVEKEAPYNALPLYKPKIYFSLRIVKAKIESQSIHTVYGRDKKIHVNVPCTEILAQMPNYVKVLKEIFSKKRKLEERKTIATTNTKIRSKNNNNTYKHELQIADKSIKFLVGIQEDVRVKVGHIYNPTDFIVVGIREDPRVPFIMRRSFLCTACTIIDVKSGTLSMEVGVERLDFIMTTMMENPYIEILCYLVEVARTRDK
ncbi:uncharacterized protein LOC131634074 [Vicia villosa]|uniref:uncharacterized protein LOC131634074 n=1 Tax=Vicia villosa TaxID=3911 RepID=UPI00273CDD12|nr:uncharacterized protein LOC131634074 [Vicia villosa]